MKHSIYLATMAALTFITASSVTTQAQAAQQAKNGKVKIFLLSGQSNMTGRGMQGGPEVPLEKQKHTLFHFVNKPENVKKYAYLIKGENPLKSEWAVRDDVFVTMGKWPHLKKGEDGHDAYKKHGKLGLFYGGRGNRNFGPELGIGHLLGNYYEDQVLLVKVSFGGNSLVRNFRPPSSGGKLGDKYPIVVQAVGDAIQHLPDIIEGYDKTAGYELVGLLWNQGLSDMNKEASAEYETNLVHFIKDIRKDLNAPNLKTVIGVTGNWGWDMADLKASIAQQAKKNPKFDKTKGQEWIESLRTIQEAQLAVSRREELRGTVGTAETRDFWRPRATFGGHGTEQHWCANGESYWLIGEAMGLEMVKLLKDD